MHPTVPTTRSAPVSETLHAETISDPYRWLEEESAETRAWTTAQNAYTGAILGALPGRERWRERLAELLAAGFAMSPEARGERLFFVQRDGDQNQPLLYVREGATTRVLLDPNGLSEQGTVALDWWYPSPDGTLVAYGLSRSGNERSTMSIRAVATGADLPERLPDTRFSSVAWLPDSSGFYYTRLPARGTVPAGQEDYNQRVRFHRLGDDPASDPVVFGEGSPPERRFAVDLSPNGHWLLITAFEGWTRADIYLLDRERPGAEVVPVVNDREALYSGQARDDALYLLTNDEAPNFRVYRVDPERLARDEWQEIVPERDAPLQALEVVGKHLALTYLRDAHSELHLLAPGDETGAVATFPGLGSISEVDGSEEEQAVYCTFTSFFDPPGVWRCDLRSGEVTVVARPVSAPTTADLIAEQVWYTSRDGTRIPMFVLRKGDLPRDGQRPTVLTGYGGFNISLTPTFNAGFLAWIERGGIIAQPSLRGGSEFGEEWHRAGMLGRKQQVFDDFIAAGEWLINSGWTSSEHLGIRGGSNGGLLVGAALTQRPELWRAAVCAVPLLDMLRYHRFLIGRLWIPEYGSADNPDEYVWLRAYSPYHHVTAGSAYPAVLFTAAESDSRVHPLHARKMTALLQAATSTDPARQPVLLRLETEAGHGAGKPQQKVLAELVDVWSFLAWQLGLD